MPDIETLDGKQKIEALVDTHTHTHNTSFDAKDYLPQRFNKELTNSYFPKFMQIFDQQLKGIEAHMNLTELDFSDINLGRLDSKNIFELAKDSCTFVNLSILNMSNNSLGFSTCSVLSGLFAKFKKNEITRLDISNNQLSLLSAKKGDLAGLLYNFKQAKHVNISNNDLYRLEFGFAVVIRALNSMGATSIEISFSDILKLEKEEYDAVISALKDSNIESLILHDNKPDYKINYDLLKARVSKLREVVSSLELHIHKNHLPSYGLKKLALSLNTREITKASSLELSFSELCRNDSNENGSDNIKTELNNLGIKWLILHDIDECYSEDPQLLIKQIDGLTNTTSLGLHFKKNKVLKAEFVIELIAYLNNSNVKSLHISPFGTAMNNEDSYNRAMKKLTEISCKFTSDYNEAYNATKSNNMVSLCISPLDTPACSESKNIRSKSDSSSMLRLTGLFGKIRPRAESSPGATNSSTIKLKN